MLEVVTGLHKRYLAYDSESVNVDNVATHLY